MAIAEPGDGVPARVTGALPGKVLMSADTEGGVWTYALELARGLSERGIAVELAVLGSAPSRAQCAMAHGIRNLNVVATGLPLDWTARSEGELIAGAERLKALAAGVDLVHLNAPGQAGPTPWPVPLVVAAHSCVGTWWRALEGASALPADLVWRVGCTARGMAIADAIIAPSISFARQLAAVYGAGIGAEIRVVHNARRWPLASPARRCGGIVTCGRLWDRAKGAAVIDRAAALLGVAIRAAGPVCGPNGEGVALPHLALLGSISAAELGRLYAEAQIFVSAARYEPFGLAVLEAARAGAPLVLADIPTFRELWHGAACFFPSGDAVGLARTLETLGRDRALRAHLGRRARARAYRFGVARNLRATLAAYEAARAAGAERLGARSAA